MARVHGKTSNIKDFYGWINERHSIFLKRQAGEEWPWTDDEILRKYKFTNVFRQLDRGTVALQRMVAGQDDPELITFNVWWYRLFNLDTHAKELGFVREFDQLETYIRERWAREEKVFTSAHMTTGINGEPKIDTYLRACQQAYDYGISGEDSVVNTALTYQRMEAVFEDLLRFYMVGRFIAYEIVCDLRFLLPGFSPTDTLTWANIGPGARRGMTRLGLPVSVDTMIALWKESAEYLEGEIRNHHPLIKIADKRGRKRKLPFELREIEHSLCEFDKYERVRRGEGRPRQLFRRNT